VRDREREIVELIPRLRRYARALTGSVDGADDLVQDCLERALGRLHMWRSGSNMRAWLFAILHNRFVNDVRRARIRPDVGSLPDWQVGGTVRAIQDDVVMLRSVLVGLRQLPDDQRAALLLIGLEEMSYREAAEVLKVPIGTLMSRLARARERLRELSGLNAAQGQERRMP
jgi:RNA polymerase sigma-70 factor (ECF subfamily)